MPSVGRAKNARKFKVQGVPIGGMGNFFVSSQVSAGRGGGLRKGVRIHTRTRCRVRRVPGVVAGGDVKSPPSSRGVMECLRG